MTRVHVVAEGQTEETFVRDVLAPWLAERSVFVTVSCVETGRRRGVVYKGGLTSYERTRREISRFLAEDPTRYVSTMFDYYALPPDFPRPTDLPLRGSPMARALGIERALSEHQQANRRFLPYVQMHEFEAPASGGIRGASSPANYIRR